MVLEQRNFQTNPAKKCFPVYNDLSCESFNYIGTRIKNHTSVKILGDAQN
jgi:hypothetical protein